LLIGPVFGILQPARQFGHALDTVINLSVAVILFDGGLNLRFHELKQAASGVRRLVYIGVPLSFVLYSLATHYVGGLSWPVALVFGAIIVVTGPTVILPLLRQAMLKRRIASFLKWEAIINDPIGALLAVLVFEYFMYSGSGAFSGQVLWNLGLAVVAGGGIGTVVAYAIGFAFKHNQVPEYLKHPIILVLVVAVFVGVNRLQNGAGLLAVTIMGIVMGNQRLAGVEEIRRFKEYLSVLLVSIVFILLTANLDPEVLKHLRWDGALLILTIMLVVRPLVVWIATWRARMRKRERMLLAWIAPRGVVAAATAGVFGPRMVAAGYADAQLLVPLMFTLIFVTVLLHGLTLNRIARTFGLAAGARNRLLIVGASPWSTAFAHALSDSGASVLLVDNSWHRLRAARLAGVPVYYGEILSESAEESLELYDVGLLLAATSNDAYNALVCTAFAPQIGRGQVFQLPMYAAEAGDPKRYNPGARGRLAFGDQALYEDLWRWLTQGWTFQKTRITESYSFEQYRESSAEGTLHLLVMHPDGRLMLHSPQSGFNPKPGDTLINFGLPRQPAPADGKPGNGAR
ncbi:MAG TPA: sodium:proton antiporter, partial [Gammaproteobacteria bacterium]|nr:sodium:proton antiporter [Gammaproteobacteria bacterium]